MNRQKIKLNQGYFIFEQMITPKVIWFKFLVKGINGITFA